MAYFTWQSGFTEMEILPTTLKVFSSVTILLHGAALEMNALKNKNECSESICTDSLLKNKNECSKSICTYSLLYYLF